MIKDCEGRVASGKRQVLDMVAGGENGLDEFNGTAKYAHQTRDIPVIYVTL